MAESEPRSVEDEKWLAAHPRLRFAFILGQKLLIPLLLGLCTIWVEARSQHRSEQNKARVDASWESLAPVVKELRGQVLTLSNQVQLLQQVVLEHMVAKSEMSSPAVKQTAQAEKGLIVAEEQRVLKLKAAVAKPAPTVVHQKTIPDHVEQLVQ